jgi:hypothetical protein
MGIDLTKDRDWLNNIREVQNTRERQQPDAEARLVSTQQQALAQQAATELPLDIADELDDDDLLTLGEKIFENYGKERWGDLLEQVGAELRAREDPETMGSLEGIPLSQQITAQRMIEEIGQSQVETWARRTAGVASA